MATTKKVSTRRKNEQFAQTFIEERVEELDNAIADVNKKLGQYEPLVDLRNRLAASRRALVGGSRSTGEGSTRLRQEDVVAYVGKNPGEQIEDIATGVSATQSATRAHLYRGEGERFLKRESDGGWFLRDPKNGINEASDLPEEDDE